MDYEKKYKEALETARKINSGEGVAGPPDWTTYEVIFPELKESEDELTWLTKYIEEEAYSLSMDIRDEEDRVKLKNLQRSLAWLEKQSTFDKCRKEGDRIVKNPDGTHFNISQLERVAKVEPRWTEEDEKIMKGAVSFLIEFRNNKGYENAVACIDWLNSIKQRMGGQQ